MKDDKNISEALQSLLSVTKKQHKITIKAEKIIIVIEDGEK